MSVEKRNLLSKFLFEMEIRLKYCLKIKSKFNANKKVIFHLH